MLFGPRLDRTLRAAARVSRTRYPAFIFGLPVSAREIPVFTYHDVEPEEFALDLEFLRANRYRTLGLDEFLHAQASGRIPRHCVLLTFDDARKSFWHTALPLLGTFDARATLFAPTYWMDPPLLRCRRPAAPDEHARMQADARMDDLFMSWAQLRACAESGFVDVQSHAHRHALVHVSNELIDFASPQALARFDLYDWPMRAARARRGVQDAWDDELGSPCAGTPVYRSMPLLSARGRYVEDAEVVHACRTLVLQCGGPAFFDDRDWRVRLQACHDAHRRRHVGHYMGSADFRKLVESEFEISRAAFETHLGRAPSCLAFPWRLGAPQSLQLARRHGLRAVFGVALDYRAAGRAQPLPVFGRLKCDWLRFLPGERRSNVVAMLGRKLAQFDKVQHLAH